MNIIIAGIPGYIFFYVHGALDNKSADRHRHIKPERTVQFCGRTADTEMGGLPERKKSI